MRRYVVGGVLGLVVVGLGLWFFWLRDRGSESADSSSSGQRSGVVSVDPSRAARGGVPTSRAGIRWSLDPDPEGPLRLEGQVVGPDGAGVGGADVVIDTVPPRTAKSEDDGTFVFDKLVGRTYSLTASNADLISGNVTYKLMRSGDPLVIRLAEAASVRVTVSDEDAKPIGGADLVVGDVVRKTGRTDDKGQVTLRPIRPGWVVVQATAPGYAPGTGYATVGAAGAVGDIAITLHKGFTVTGKVVDEAGRPIARARIYASGGAWEDWLTESMGGGERREVVSDAEGAFVIPALATGSHTISALDGDHAPETTKITVNDGPVSGVQLVMKAGGVVRGTVVDSGGQPVGFASVKLATADGNPWAKAARQTTSDERGSFEVRGLARSRYSARAESDAAASKVEAVDVATTPRAELRLVLDIAGTIAGMVVDETGAPVAEVSVHAFPDFLSNESNQALALAGMSSATSDGAGAFVVRGLPDGNYRVWADRGAAQGVNWGERGVTARTGDKAVRVVLAKGGGLAGKIALSSGKPPKLAYVQLGYQPPAPTSGDGAFTFKNLTPGNYNLTVRGPEFAELTKYSVEIKPGTTTDLGTVTVHQGRRLTGKVVDSSGQPVVKARVRLAEMLFEGEGADTSNDDVAAAAWGLRSATTDSDGSFAIVGIPQQATSVVAIAPTGRSLAASVPAGVEDPPAVTLTLKGFGTITGVVTLKGEPVQAAISASPKGSSADARIAQSDATGKFTLTKVPEGTIILQVVQQKMMALKSSTSTVDVAAGRESKVAIDIPVGQVTLTVEIKPLPGATVNAAQIFLIAGTVAPKNAKQLTDGLFQGGLLGMKIWLGLKGVEFDELLPGEYSACAIPITGDLMAIQQKLQKHMDLLKVYCKPVRVAAAPLKQTLVQELPSMDPLPES